jgi:malto-oligosyltrehalose trehalohydrolase
MSGMNFGPQITPDGATFRLWAPAARSVDVTVGRRKHALGKRLDGWFSGHIRGVKAGALYRFLIDGALDVPDPASAFQPDDIDGPSQLVDHEAFQWQTNSWKGRPWHEAIFSECHVGTYSPDGSYAGFAQKLEQLVETGITAIELMPLADFPGRRNWGYDGVLWYAPDHSYGTPDQLKSLIDDAHRIGLMVFLDVVYNHFGPQGNYLPRYAPQFFRPSRTPWGDAIDYSVREVRGFAVENAVHWIKNYRFDGLRLDAVHALAEPGGLQMLEELSKAVGAVAQASGRYIHLVLENDDNRASVLDPVTEPASGKFRAQWNDDYHHAWHTLLTGEAHGYYADYAPQAKQLIARTLGSGFAYQGEPSKVRAGEPRGELSGALSSLAFVNFLQNHDQIGNRALGDRLELSGNASAIEAALAITLLAPMPPLLFMGEEWGARSPFPFFCDFAGELAQQVRDGRRREFAEAYAKYGSNIPDLLDPTTFEAARLDWSARESSGKARHQFVKALLTIRHREIIPHAHDVKFGQAQLSDHDSLHADWKLSGGRVLTLHANLGDRAGAPIDIPPRARLIWGKSSPSRLPPWSVLWTVEPS